MKDKKKYDYKYRERGVHIGVEYDIKAKTQKELSEKLRKRISEIENMPDQLENKDIKVKKWGEKWLNDYIDSPDIERGTYNDYESRLKKHIYPVIGNKKLIDVRHSDCQKIMKNISDYSRDRISKINRTLVRMFDAAVANNIIRYNPAISLKKPKGKKSKGRRMITATERALTLEVAKTNYAGKWVLTILYTGLRSQEIIALQGRHLDFKNGFIIVEDALKKDGYIGSTKTEAGNRKVPMSDDFLELFKDSKFEPFEFIFKRKPRPEKNAKMDLRGMSVRSYYIQWHSFKLDMQLLSGAAIDKETGKIKEPAPFDDLDPYTYRHTFATDCRDKGMGSRELKYIMGHEDERVANIVYTKDTNISLAAAKDIMNNQDDPKKEEIIMPNKDMGRVVKIH